MFHVERCKTGPVDWDMWQKWLGQVARFETELVSIVLLTIIYDYDLILWS